MVNDSDETREQGIEFGGLADDLEDESYPLSHEELLGRYGDHELTLIGEQVTLEDVLSPGQERTYDDAEGVRQAVFTMVGDDAVGREGYSDRGGTGSNADDSGETNSV